MNISNLYYLKLNGTRKGVFALDNEIKKWLKNDPVWLTSFWGLSGFPNADDGRSGTQVAEIFLEREWAKV